MISGYMGDAGISFSNIGIDACRDIMNNNIKNNKIYEAGVDVMTPETMHADRIRRSFLPII